MTEQLKAIMSKAFRVPVEKISDQATMKDVSGWDSLTHIDLILALEEKFQVHFTGEDIAQMQNLKAIEAVLKKYVEK